MTFDKFKEEFDCAPFDIKEFAYGAYDIEDNPSLQLTAAKFLEAQTDFENALDKAGIEIG